MKNESLDTSKFELTPEEIAEHAIVCWGTLEPHQQRSFQLIAKAQISKVLFYFEPVELEALEKEDIYQLVTAYHFSGEQNRHSLAKQVSNETVQHNQRKGQLFRLKEE